MITKRAIFNLGLASTSLLIISCTKTKVQEEKPNILFFVTDDQSWEHIRALGCNFVNTPAMDKIVKEGVNFTNAHVAAPQCGPSRAAMLTGKYCWQLGSSGVHSSVSSNEFVSIAEVLEENGYHCGFTGKGAEPGWWTFGGRHQSFAGPEYTSEKLTEHFHWFYGTDYFRNFNVFLSEKDENQPFYFMLSPFEPHRDFRAGGGQLCGKKLEDATVPGFLPDVPAVKDDILDYGSRIDYADQHLYQVMDLLKKRGELENTIIIFTSDNGMAFPGAKATCYEYGTHVPFAILWGDKIKGNRNINDPVSLVDLFPTLTDILGIDWRPKDGFSGVSLKEMLFDENAKLERKAIFTSRERHATARWINLGYPQRAIRTNNYLYVYNFHPERWPAGSPDYITDKGDTISFGEIRNDDFYREYSYLPDNKFVPDEAKKQIWFKWYNTIVNTFEDVDHSPTKTYLIQHRDDNDVRKMFEHAFGKQGHEMLFDIVSDPECLNNLANDPKYSDVKSTLNKDLFNYLKKTEDARVVGDNPDIYEQYRSIVKPMPPIPKPQWAIEQPGLARKYETMMTKSVLEEPYVKIGGELRNDTLFYFHWVLTRKDHAINWNKQDNLILYNTKDDPAMKENVVSKNHYGTTKLLQLAIALEDKSK